MLFVAVGRIAVLASFSWLFLVPYLGLSTLFPLLGFFTMGFSCEGFNEVHLQLMDTLEEETCHAYLSSFRLELTHFMRGFVLL